MEQGVDGMSELTHTCLIIHGCEAGLSETFSVSCSLLEG